MLLRMLDFPDQKSISIPTNPYVSFVVEGQHYWAFLQDVILKDLGGYRTSWVFAPYISESIYAKLN